MKWTVGLFRMGMVWLALSSQGVWAQASLQEVRVNPQISGRIELELSFSEPVSGITDRLNYQPDRLRLHIPGAVGTLKDNPLPIRQQGISDVRVENQGAGLDIEIGMDELMPYQVSQQGSLVRISMGSADPVQPVPAASPRVATAPLAKPLPARAAMPSVDAMSSHPSRTTAASGAQGFFNAVRNLDFRRGKDGRGEFLVRLENSTSAMDISAQGQKVIAKFFGTQLPDEWLNIMEVADFATPVTRIEAFRQGKDTRFELSINGAFDYRYDQAENLFIIQVDKKLPTTQVATKYGGKPISLNFQNIPVRTVLQLIADFNNFNLVTTDTVNGNITLRLDGVPWEQALDVILKVKGLDKRLDNNILLVAPAEEIAAREKQQLENRTQVADLAPLETEYLQVNYAKASEVAALLSSEKTKLLSNRGAVSVDERTNIMVIKDTAEVLANVRRMLDMLDIPVKQVVIEARMVTIDDGFDEQLGVRWGVTKNDGHGNSTSGSIEGNDGSGNNDGGSTITRPDADDRLNVNLPVANAAGTIAFQVARLADGTLLDLELSALEKESKAEIIASPRVTTANQKPALIEQGTEIPYVESSSSGATSVTFKKAVLSLKVTPQITPDNRVILDLTVTQDTKGETVPTGTGDAVSINAQSITTQVLVDNGETLVLGGIYQQTIKNDISKVPLLGDIPGLGILFKKTVSENKKRELLIFVTPRIVADNL